MIILKQAQVFKYKSIEDSTPVEITDGVTVIVGKNESGKTAFLEALHKALPLGSKAKFNHVFDYPRKDYVRYLKEHQASNYTDVVVLTFKIQKDLTSRINKEVFAGQEILKADHEFSKTVNYGNEMRIGFDIDMPKALTVLKKEIAGIEHTDEVFNGAGTLSDVVAKIEELKLPADHKLALFSKTWRDRFSGAPKGWDMLDWHIWKAYLKDAAPVFLYFGDYNNLTGKINLEALKNRKANNTLSEPDETAMGLFDLAGTNLTELMSDEGYETSRAKLEAIGLTITQQVFEFWKQNQELSVEFDIKADPKDEAPFNSGKNLYIRVKNLRHGVTVPFDQRSKGFIWFFSFMVWFSAIGKRVKTDKQLILLLDEPGLSLHALAQADFLSYIESLARDHQILYTTHSPFMVDSEQLHNVRVVEDRPREGTRITAQLAGSTDDSLFPLQAALGYSIAQNLFIAKKNILIEGPADFLLLQHMAAIQEESGKYGLGDSVLVPVGGLDKLATFVALLGASKLKLAVLHDRGSSSNQRLEDLVRQKLVERKRILDFGMFRLPENQETDVEDLFPEKLYLEAFNDVYKKELGGKTATISSLGKHPRIVERINQWLSSEKIVLLKDGGFNHYRVAQALLPKLRREALPKEMLDSFEALFQRVQAALS